MRKEDCIEIGYIAKAHGLKGEVKAIFDVQDIGDYQNRKTLYFSKKDDPVEPIKVKSFELQPKKSAIIKFKGLRYRDEAESLVGSTLYIPISELPELPKGKYYYFQVEGFQVEDKILGELGKVKSFVFGSAQDILIMDYQEKEILIPMTDEFILSADLEGNILHTNLPEGLLDLYE